MTLANQLVSKEGSNNTRPIFMLNAVADFLVMPGLNPDPVGLVSKKKSPEDLVSFRGLLIPKGEWVARPLTEYERKILGVEFEGVMCSLCAEDQWGLASIRPYVLAGMPIRYEFKNGNKITLSTANIAAFEQTWLATRMAFFPLE